MTRYTEKKKVNLLDGAQDREGDPVTIRRINGEIPDSWPKMVSLSVGEAEVSQDGTVLYDDGGTVDGHPAIGSIIGGAFTFTIWDGIEESVPYNATVQLNGEPLSLPLKQQITLLRDDPSTCGRQSNKTLKVPGFDPLPRGMKETKNKKGKPILMIGSKCWNGAILLARAILAGQIKRSGRHGSKARALTSKCQRSRSSAGAGLMGCLRTGSRQWAPTRLRAS